MSTADRLNISWPFSKIFWYGYRDNQEFHCCHNNYLTTAREHLNPEIKLTQQELFELSYEKVKIIQKIQYCYTSQKELSLFYELPDTLQNKFTNRFHICDYLAYNKKWNFLKGKYYYDYKKMNQNHTMKFHYYKKLTPTTLGSVEFLA